MPSLETAWIHSRETCNRMGWGHSKFGCGPKSASQKLNRGASTRKGSPADQIWLSTEQVGGTDSSMFLEHLDCSLASVWEMSRFSEKCRNTAFHAVTSFYKGSSERHYPLKYK